MDMMEKLRSLELHFADLEARLGAAETYADPALVARLNKEQRELEPKKPKKQPQKPAEKKVSTTEAGRVGERPYARGRSYREDRYDDKE